MKNKIKSAIETVPPPNENLVFLGCQKKGKEKEARCERGERRAERGGVAGREWSGAGSHPSQGQTLLLEFFCCCWRASVAAQICSGEVEGTLEHISCGCSSSGRGAPS